MRAKIWLENEGNVFLLINGKKKLDASYQITAWSGLPFLRNSYLGLNFAHATTFVDVFWTLYWTSISSSNKYWMNYDYLSTPAWPPKN